MYGAGLHELSQPCWCFGWLDLVNILCMQWQSEAVYNSLAMPGKYGSISAASGSLVFLTSLWQWSLGFEGRGYIRNTLELTTPVSYSLLVDQLWV